MNKKIILGMLALILAFGMMVAGCGGDGGTIRFDPIDASSVPSFTGTPVTSEKEAEELADEALAVIDMILEEAGVMPGLFSASRNGIPSPDLNTTSVNITLNHNGITGYYKADATYNDSGSSVNFSINTDILVRVDGTYTYAGTTYRIQGLAEETKANLNGSVTQNSFSMRGFFSSRSGFSVTRLSDGVGMKFVSTANLTLNVSNNSDSIRGMASIKVFDNSNNVIFSYEQTVDDIYGY